MKQDKISIVVYKPGFIMARKSMVLTKKKEEITMALVRFKGTATIRYPYERRKTTLTINGRTQRRRPPINLRGLGFGSKVTVKLTKDGYDPFEKTYVITQNDQPIIVPPAARKRRSKPA